MLLLQNGANPNLKSLKLSQTPLHLAYQQRHNDDIINILFKFNADNSIKDSFGKKPSDYETNVLRSSENENNTMTYQENTFTLENNLDSFVTSNKEDISKNTIGKEYTETVQSNTNNNILITNTYNSNLFSELQSEEKRIDTPKKIEGRSSLNDSLEEDKEDDDDLIYSKSKSYYVSDFPFSSVKKEGNFEGNTKENLPEALGENNPIGLENIPHSTPKKPITGGNNNSSVNNNSNSKNSKASPENSNQKITDPDSLYKKLIIAKRLNFCNRQLSYHRKEKSNASFHPLIDTYNNSKQHKACKTNLIENYKEVKETENEGFCNLSQNISGIGNNLGNICHINNTCIHNTERNNTNPNIFTNNKITAFLNATSNNITIKQNLTDIDLDKLLSPDRKTAHQQRNLTGNYLSGYSTKERTEQYETIKSKKKFLLRNLEENSSEGYLGSGRVSEFKIINSTGNNNNTNQGGFNTFLIKEQEDYQLKSVDNQKEIESLSDWLDRIEMGKYLNLFINNNLISVEGMVNAMKNPESRFIYEDFEKIGIKKAGHIFRILTKLEYDAGLIDKSVCTFILPFKKIQNSTESVIETGNKINLKISNEYCCGCLSAKNVEVKNDLKSFLRKSGIFNFYANFYHNGFDNLEFIILQMYSSFQFNHDILENCLHVYDEDERTVILQCLIEEIKKINLFVTSQEFMNNPYHWKYSNIQLEKEDHMNKKESCNCIIY